ncbi:MAG: IS66 family insertion sequence element accessory protein TnpB [Nitrospira sp.]|nr:IS66 family insertion sequence element accessory protein TnpB [Nitrospira sp.]
MASKRVRLGREDWRALIARQAKSGLSVAAFCAHERLGAASFYQWRSRLSGEAKRSDIEPREAFLDLGTVRDSGRFELRIDLGGGLVLQLVRG